MTTITTEASLIAQRLALRREIARESDRLYAQAEPLAQKLLQAYGKGEQGPTQIRNLENLAYTTDRLSDVYDLLKRQIGRSAPSQHWRFEGVGQEVLDALAGLSEPARLIANRLKAADPDLPRQVHLMLIREYVKHLAAHYLYVRGQEPRQ